MAIDPRRLRPSMLTRILNSTPVRYCLSDRQLRRHRNRAGYRLGDEKHADLFRYANRGQSTDVVYQFCRPSAHAAILLPSHGRYVGPSSVPFSEYKRKRGDRVGHHCRIPNVQGRRQVRHVVIDTNYWKSFVHSRSPVAMGDRGCLSLFGKTGTGSSGATRTRACPRLADADHRLFADHVTPEYPVRTEARGRVVDQWKLRAGSPDNHPSAVSLSALRSSPKGSRPNGWFDSLVGCAVAASIHGAMLPGTDRGAPKRRQRVNLWQLQRGRH